MHRKILFVLMLAAPIAIGPQAALAAKLNVVLIAIDDLNNDLGCYGHTIVRSPNIDGLAARGIKFERAYCQYPVCNPSRVSLLAGRRPDTTRIRDLQTPPRTFLKEVVFLPQYFRQQAYFTAHVGKIFHTGPEFEDPKSWDCEIRETGKHPPQSAILREKKIKRTDDYSFELTELNTTDAETADGVVARQAAAMLKENAATDKPFFLAVGFRRPHAPYAAPRMYFEMYPPNKIPPLSEPAEHLTDVPFAAFTYPVSSPNFSDAERREGAAAYYACVSFVDAQVGFVLEAIGDLGLWKNTIVVLYGDHGYHLGEHGGMWHKMSVFEESARVPLIIAAPCVTDAGQPCNRVVELVDVYPTLVDLCGLPMVSDLEGKSLRPLLHDPQASWSDCAFTQVLRGKILGRSVRTSRWRYTEWDEGREGLQLYDHDADPHEYVNLASRPELTSVVSQLRQRLREQAASAKLD